jgi:hypothetical protein
MHRRICERIGQLQRLDERQQSMAVHRGQGLEALADMIFLAAVPEDGLGQIAGEIERTVLECSDEVKMRWINMVNVTESMLRSCEYLHDIIDFTSKSMEITY